MKQLFENITDDEYKTLDWILHNPDLQPADRFFDDPAIDGRIFSLEQNNLVIVCDAGVEITELGRAALVEYNKLKKSRRLKLIWEIIRFVVPTIISIIAIVISVISLLK